jgi:hypothetical protein
MLTTFKQILALASVLFVFSAVRADDYKDYIAFERMKLKTYKEAIAEHEKDHKPVIVWVRQADFDAWKQTKDLGIHCFMKEFPGKVVVGAVVGKTYKGEFCRFGDVPIRYDHRDSQIRLLVEGIRTAINASEPMMTTAPLPPPVEIKPQFSPPPTLNFGMGFQQNCFGGS